MASDINRLTLTGRLTRDPEIRMTQGGSAVLEFGLAVGERRKRGEQWEDYTNFLDCTIFGARAESLSRILAKGMQVAVEGRVHWSQWEKDGQKRSKVTVTVDNIVLPPRGDQQPAPVQADAGSAYAAQSQQIYDEDIPF